MFLPKSYFERGLSYRAVLNTSAGDIFVSSVTASGITSESLDLLTEKLEEGHRLRFLILDPVYAKNNKEQFPFEDDLIENIEVSLRSLEKINHPNLEVRTYSFFMPFIMTGFDSGAMGEIICEVIDYLKDSKSPLLDTSKENKELFDTIKGKYEFYWSNSKPVSWRSNN